MYDSTIFRQKFNSIQFNSNTADYNYTHSEYFRPVNVIATTPTTVVPRHEQREEGRASKTCIAKRATTTIGRHGNCYYCYSCCVSSMFSKINRFHTRPLVICLVAHTHSPMPTAAGKRNAKSHCPAHHDAPQEKEGLMDRTHAAVHCCISDSYFIHMCAKVQTYPLL